MKKLAFVSTYPPFKCAIGIYKKHLVEAIAEQTNSEILVVTEGGAGQRDRITAIDTYSRRGDFHTPIVEQIEQFAPDVVHFQHAPDMFPQDRMFLETVAALAQNGAGIFITLHTVYDDARWLAFYRQLSDHASFIVHNELCRQTLLKAVSNAASVIVIPHGTTALTLPEQGEAKAKFGIAEDQFVFLFFGAIHVMKNLHTIVLAYNDLQRHHRDGILVVAGRPWRDRFYNKIYVAACKALSRRRAEFRWDCHYIADEDVPYYFAAANAILLPYWQKYHSSSGVMHMAMAARKPVICSDSPKFEEIKTHLGPDSDIFVPTLKRAAWTREMARMIDDSSLRERVAAALYAYGEETSWEIVARAHLRAYASA